MPASHFTAEGLPPWLWKAAAVAIGGSGPLVGLLLFLGAPSWGAVALHLVAAAASYLMWRKPGPRGQMLGLQAFSLCLCFPVVGSPAAWLIYGRESERAEGLLDDYRRYIAYEHGEPRYVRPLKDPKAALRRELAVRPLGDQLSDADDLVGKQNAAAALERLEGDLGTRVLQQALTHPADDTRLLASLALLRKEEALVRKLKAARATAQGHRDDPQAQLLVADAARKYAESGLPAAKVAEAFWRECLEAAERSLSLNPRPQTALHAQRLGRPLRVGRRAGRGGRGRGRARARPRQPGSRHAPDGVALPAGRAGRALGRRRGPGRRARQRGLRGRPLLARAPCELRRPTSAS